MRNFAIGMLLVIFLSILIEPMVEILHLGRDKVVLGTSITNAARAAKDRSLEYQQQRSLDATVDEETFVKYFSKAFEAAMHMRRSNPDNSNGILKFSSENGKFNEVTVTLNFTKAESTYTEQQETKVEIRAESKYKFKTKYLQLAESVGKDVDSKLVVERTLVLSIKN